jgi:hypothetical protein
MVTLLERQKRHLVIVRLAGQEYIQMDRLKIGLKMKTMKKLSVT